MVMIEDLVKSGNLKKIDNLYFRQNKYENSIILTSDEFEGEFIKNHVLNNMQNLNIKEIELNDVFGFCLNDIKFVNQITWIEGIKIIVSGGVNSNNLKYLTNIKRFVNNYTSESVDFSCFRMLEEADILWSKGRDNILDLESLKSLTIHKFSLKNLKGLKKLKNLKKLSLLGSSIENLEGIENLPNLESLELHLNRKIDNISALINCKELKEIRFTSLSKLESLSGLEDCKMLEVLIIENCKKVTDNSSLFKLRNLKIFSYSSSGEFESIDEIDNLFQLERLNFSETNIKDGNLNPLLKLNKLIFCFFKDRKYYSLKLQEVKSKLGIA